MLFGQEFDNFIKNYEINNNIIKVNYFNDSFCSIENTKENETKILNVMLEQAEKIIDSGILEIAKNEKQQSIFWTIGNAVLTTLCGTYTYNSDDIIVKMSTGFLATMSFVAIFMNIKDYKELKKIEEKLKKYNIYLAIKPMLDKTNINKMLSEINSSNNILNINMLDSYTLEDLQKIKGYLEQHKQKKYKYTLKK